MLVMIFCCCPSYACVRADPNNANCWGKMPSDVSVNICWSFNFHNLVNTVCVVKLQTTLLLGSIFHVKANLYVLFTS